jgi:hypothetical protein
MSSEKLKMEGWESFKKHGRGKNEFRILKE